MNVVSCPHCGREYNVTDDKLGRTGTCKECRAKFVLVVPCRVQPAPPVAAPPVLAAPPVANSHPQATLNVNQAHHVEAPTKTGFLAGFGWTLGAMLAAGIVKVIALVVTLIILLGVVVAIAWFLST